MSRSLRWWVVGVGLAGVGVILLLACRDLPTFGSIAAIEARLRVPVLTSNQTILWRALRTANNTARIASLGKLFNA